MSDVWNPDGDGWTPLFSRVLNDWEIELVERFLHKIQTFRVQREEENRVIWTASKCGVFSIKSLYSILEPGVSPLFPSGSIWRVSVPPKVAFFAWEASWGKVLTLEQLQRRGYSLENRCFLCLSEIETVDHLLLHCVKTRVLFSPFLVWLGLSRVQRRKLFLGGMERLWGKHKKGLANGPLMYILVSLEGKEFVSFWE